MRPIARRWKLMCRYSRSMGQRSNMHASHQSAELSYLLQDPRQFPVVIVVGPSSSACTALYRALPTAAYTAYSSEGMVDQNTALSSPDCARLPRPSSMRLVAHTSALLGPEACEQTEAYVEVIRAAAESVDAADTESLLDAADGDNAMPSETGGVLLPTEYTEGARQHITSAFNEQFLSLIKDSRPPPSMHEPRGEAATVQPVGKAGSQLLHHGLLHDGELRGVGCGAIISHRGLQCEAQSYHIHWVVTRWLTSSDADVRNVIDAWRSVLIHSRSGEVVSLLLFVNTDTVDATSLLSDCIGHRLKTGRLLHGDTAHGMNVCHASPLPHGCSKCTAVWYPLALRSQLRAALLPLCAQLNTLAESFSAYAPSAERADIGRAVRRVPAQIGAAADPPQRTVQVAVPIVYCWDTWNTRKKFECSDQAVMQTAYCFTQLSSVFDRNHPEHRRSRCLRLSQLQRISYLQRKWQWLLQKNSSPYPVPRPGEQVSCALPYVLVKGREDQLQEHQRALRRNAVDAETLQRLNSGALSAGFSTAVGPPTSAPFPNPRYFTTLVSDAGSLLARDGCLTDLFVMEFQPALRGANMSSPYSHCVGASTLAGKTLSLRRHNARLELLSVTKKFLAAATPSSSLTRIFLKCATRFLGMSGRGRCVLAWPLTDPVEGGHCLRVAFTLSYEFHEDPFVFLQRLRGSTRAGDGGRAQMYRPASGDDLVSCTAAVAAGSENSQLPLVVETVEHVMRRILSDMRMLGWVLVWQENHHRWPTAVPPPYMHSDIDTLSSPSSLRRSYRPGLQSRVAASLEKWRHEQLRCHRKRYDADVSAGELTVPSSNESAESPKAASQGAAAASAYNSLDVWQAALIPEDAGVYLWEGQTVFLDDGLQGVIVEFRTPPAELFTSFEHHSTEAKRMYWRKQQRRYSDFIRFYRWRRRCCAAVHPRVITAAFTALPHYVREREMTHFPVVELLDAWIDGKRPRVHVLPIRAARRRVSYPRVCVVTVAEQRNWHEAQGWSALAGDELRDEVWKLPSKELDGRSAVEVTLLRLPLSPFRIEDVASLFVSRVMSLSKVPLDLRAQRALRCRPDTSTDIALLQRLNAEWAGQHHTLAKGDSAAQRVRAAHQRGQINWRSFIAEPQSMAALSYALDPARDVSTLT